ncbi:hypothetical protein OCJ35_21870 [Pluralibacter gergoviae]|uniref:hypothetical protein n=1 Tax=Pluralibacter gergoviae TaxID=61647 RepID=UPI000650BC8C|nr:hypothetical protein [Pluralibacter gergoviae]KMK16773.1 hypothetical protein ABW09_18510 [Pluralibacter gergoviae]MCK1068662.1 hypothetical protein [Pluralibacter gergoviae]MCV7760735.1 hypothetical protein [Pluralibacter gergoviae]PHH48665.1 hypothetical protein CRX51_24175 [Pluralibacter gergoviae]HDS1115189.1 hypothetical protein [Pluralibacter gergoviae]
MLKKLLVLLALSLLAGCVQKPLVTVNALSAGQSVGKKFVIIPASQEIWNTKQIEFIQIAAVVADSLTRQGYTQVKDEKLADQAILLNFVRSGAVSNTRNVTVPVYGQTGVSSATTYGSASTTLNSYGSGYGTANTTGTSTTVYTPTYGITGAYNTTVTDTFYGAGVILQSFDAKAYLNNKMVIMLWKVGSSVVSQQSDGIADYKGLARIAASYAGKNTDGDKIFNVDPKAPN